MICQQRDRYSQQRLESIPWSAIYGLHIADRRKHHPTAVRGIVPITSHKNPTAGRPDIPRWNPDPVWAARLPVARRPEITFRLPLPMTWHPERVISRLRAAGAALQGGWGLRQIGLLSGLRRCPVTGHPLVLTAEIIPVSRNPLPIRRNSAPDAADPDKVVRLIVPCPVSRDPKDIISLGTLIRRQFLNGWGRFFWYNEAGLRIEDDDLAKGLMQGTSGEILRARRCGKSVRILSSLSRDAARKEGQYAEDEADSIPTMSPVRRGGCFVIWIKRTHKKIRVKGVKAGSVATWKTDASSRVAIH